MKHTKIDAEVSAPDCDNEVWLHLHRDGHHIDVNLGDAGQARASELLNLAGLPNSRPGREECEDAEIAREPDKR